MDRDEITEGQYIYRSDTNDVGIFYAMDPARLAEMIVRHKRSGEVWPFSPRKYDEVFGVAPKKPSLVERLRNWLGH